MNQEILQKNIRGDPNLLMDHPLKLFKFNYLSSEL